MDKIKSIFVRSIIMVTIILQYSCSDEIERLGNGYFYRDEGGSIKDILCEHPNGSQIPATVVDYVYNNKFILAKQKPKIPQEPLYDKIYTYPNGNEQFYYWLIIKESHTVLGPLSITKLDSIKTKYKVSIGLKIR